MYFSGFSAFIVAALVACASAGYSATSKNNVAIYYGQGPNEGTSNGYTLASFCSQTSLDIILIGFVNYFPSQGNGYPGTNFGSNCWAGSPTNYPGPGWAGVNNPANDHLIIDCHLMTKDLPFCKAQGKTILLSIGGGTNTYSMTDNNYNEGPYTATFLWKAFGPYDPSWTGPRPFDYNGIHNSVDGFDFDIENHSSDVGYIKMIVTLRNLFPAGSNYLITGAPQCVYPDANMGNLFPWVAFDILFIQFYNSNPCSARGWVNYNPNFATTGKEGLSYFSYRQWSTGLAKTVNKNTKLFIGLLGSPAATSSGNENFYITPAEANELIQAYYCDPSFGGIMIYEATYSQFNFAGPYHQAIKQSLLNASTNTNLSCVTAAPKNNFVQMASTLSTVTATTSTSKSSSSTTIATTTRTSSSSSSSLSSSSSSTTVATITRTSSSSSTSLTTSSTTTSAPFKSSRLRRR